MKKRTSWRAWSVSALLLLQLTSVVSPLYVSAGELEPEAVLDQEVEKTESVQEPVGVEEAAAAIESAEPVNGPIEENTKVKAESMDQNLAAPLSSDGGAPETTMTGQETTPAVRTFSAVQKPSATKEVNYVASIYQGNRTIDTLPWGEPNFSRIGWTKDHVGKMVPVTKENAAGTYAYAYIEGLGHGWIDKRALKVVDVVSAEEIAYIGNGNYEVDTLPWGTEGYQKIGRTSQYLGQKLQIRYKTANGAYSYVEKNGLAIGWIDSRAFGLSGDKHSAIITDGRFNVDTLPWGTPGFVTLGRADQYIGLELTVLGSTQNNNYQLLTYDGEEIGWVDSRALVQFDTKTVDYSDYITTGSFNIGGQRVLRPSARPTPFWADMLLWTGNPLTEVMPMLKLKESQKAGSTNGLLA